ncbi:hypothetical protein M514_06041 [Trichuris suis]|uniref:Uncharacterized protein n=1 Tax=Trichuris suis TaxID=68888 RepID=A0A085M7D1_9BILA|nr:hypothetical protein M513_06041 [Trichuris suis]KFD70729.1 hypothetical protein M514_06041 [Trichuris suis]
MMKSCGGRIAEAIKRSQGAREMPYILRRRSKGVRKPDTTKALKAKKELLCEPACNEKRDDLIYRKTCCQQVILCTTNSAKRPTGAQTKTMEVGKGSLDPLQVVGMAAAERRKAVGSMGHNGLRWLAPAKCAFGKKKGTKSMAIRRRRRRRFTHIQQHQATDVRQRPLLTNVPPIRPAPTNGYECATLQRQQHLSG